MTDDNRAQHDELTAEAIIKGLCDFLVIYRDVPEMDTPYYKRMVDPLYMLAVQELPVETVQAFADKHGLNSALARILIGLAHCMHSEEQAVVYDVTRRLTARAEATGMEFRACAEQYFRKAEVRDLDDVEELFYDKNAFDGGGTPVAG